MPKNGTMSTCNQFSTADPTTAPATRPPMYKDAPKLEAKISPGTSAAAAEENVEAPLT
ncbi:hypothetical protein RHGRI_032935 [Rhododendron griersonianum]|uniref:Ribulose-1,5-bisphosphate carboxylase/oxygenase large subunit n=1 Tax=Rhododendron griersonianum TaxID=479676 RepID=A0AAV6IED2_9ERIC|nr:hypothetical protein RHGRI_032935 [Rhododendron griersonianum]